MKKLALLTGSIILAAALSVGCIASHTWPNYERSADTKMVVIQEKIGNGLKTGALTPDQSQMYLTTLKGIRTDYEALRDKRVPQAKWNNLDARLDALGAEIDKALARPATIATPGSGDRILRLQKDIDDGKLGGRLPLAEGRDFQTRLDSIRSDYLRMTQTGRPMTAEEQADISQRLDSLEVDLNRYR
jgi:hypothetical protein